MTANMGRRAAIGLFPAKDPKMLNTVFRPLHDRVVVRRGEAEAKTKSGIILPVMMTAGIMRVIA